MTTKKRSAKKITSLTHKRASRKNIPTAEHEPLLTDDDKTPIQVAYERRNRDLDPQLIWRGKGALDLTVQAAPLYIQEKVKPKMLIDDLLRESARSDAPESQIDLFADFNGLPNEQARTEFYQHDANWSNRMILGDSMQVMASLAEREGLRGKVQCIYFDPPYGVKFKSNFQWSTTTKRVADSDKLTEITRDPEQVRAFRDTWRDGVHSYLSYLRDRLVVARDLLTDSGSVFVQIGDENVHLVRSLMDEVFGNKNFVSEIIVRKTTSEGANLLGSTCDFIIWFAKNRDSVVGYDLFRARSDGAEGRYTSRYMNGEIFRVDTITSSRAVGDGDVSSFEWRGINHNPGKGTFKTSHEGLCRLARADRLLLSGKGKLNYRRFKNDFGYGTMGNLWSDISGAVQSRSDPKIYVVQSSTSIVERCLLLASSPGDLVLDPTCGSGTTAYVAEQWGRRWITIDTSRVALALARARIMGARYPYYQLAGDTVQEGFDYQRVPHITLKSIANNAEIDVIFEKYESMLEALRFNLNVTLKQKWQEWEIPREADDDWSKEVRDTHAKWWKTRIARQKEIDQSIAAKADYETLYDKPREDKNKVRVAGPFTVDSISPHRTLIAADDSDAIAEKPPHETDDFATMILENLKIAGVQQAHKEDRIEFTSLNPWPGDLICGEGRYDESGGAKRAAIFIGPEFGTVARADLVVAAREAVDAEFDVLIACAFNFEAHTAELEKLGRLPVLKARMNADLHMAEDLAKTKHGNLFVIFGEPDIEIQNTDDGNLKVKLKGVDVYHPNSGEVRSDNADGIACWFIDTDYNEESFFVRHAYFLGAGDPYKSLKTTLRAEINEEVWATLNSDISRAFAKPKNGRIAVKVINHLGDEVMKVFKV